MKGVIRGYRAGDEAGLIELWNASLSFDSIDQDLFRRKVILDPNFDPARLSVAEAAGHIQGFCLALIRRVPIEGSPIETDRGWITGLGVALEDRGRGIGQALLDRATGLLRQAGRTEVWISPYSPNYFAPGVDRRYEEGIRFLQNRGFQVVSRPLAMEARLTDLPKGAWRTQESIQALEGIVLRPLTPEDIPSFLGFLRATMPPDWQRVARELLQDATRGLAQYDQVVLALRGDEPVGYAQFDRERFGPFGVRPDLQGQGIGSALLARSLQSMREQGLQRAWLMWTSEEVARGVYSKFGFQETRRFLILRKALED